MPKIISDILPTITCAGFRLWTAVHPIKMSFFFLCNFVMKQAVVAPSVRPELNLGLGRTKMKELWIVTYDYKLKWTCALSIYCYFCSWHIRHFTFFLPSFLPRLSRLWRSSWVRCVAGSCLTVLGSSPNLQLLSFLWPASLTSPEPLSYFKHIRYGIIFDCWHDWQSVFQIFWPIL